MRTGSAHGAVSPMARTRMILSMPARRARCSPDSGAAMVGSLRSTGPPFLPAGSASVPCSRFRQVGIRNTWILRQPIGECSQMLKQTVTHESNCPVILVDSITKVDEGDDGAIVISGSHG